MADDGESVASGLGRGSASPPLLVELNEIHCLRQRGVANGCSWARHFWGSTLAHTTCEGP